MSTQPSEKLSLWHFSSVQEENRVIAAFVAKKTSAATLATFLFPESFLAKATVVFMRDTDEDNYDCIKQLHISADLSSEATRHKLASEIVTAFDSGQWDPKSGLKKVIKSKNAEFVKQVLTTCETKTVEEIKATFPKWLANKLAAS